MSRTWKRQVGFPEAGKRRDDILPGARGVMGRDDDKSIARKNECKAALNQ